MEITFPPTFLWGTATAAHQVEGGNVYNDTWAMEHAAGSAFVESSDDACDHYHRYREDIALLIQCVGELLLVEQLAQRSSHVAGSTRLWRAFILWWMIGHRLDAQATRSREAVEYDRCTRHEAADGTEKAAAAAL